MKHTRESLIELINDSKRVVGRIDLSDQDLSSLDLSGANLRGANLQEASLQSADLHVMYIKGDNDG